MGNWPKKKCYESIIRGWYVPYFKPPMFERNFGLFQTPKSSFPWGWERDHTTPAAVLTLAKKARCRDSDPYHPCLFLWLPLFFITSDWFWNFSSLLTNNPREMLVLPAAHRAATLVLTLPTSACNLCLRFLGTLRLWLEIKEKGIPPAGSFSA